MLKNYLIYSLLILPLFFSCSKDENSEVLQDKSGKDVSVSFDIELDAGSNQRVINPHLSYYTSNYEVTIEDSDGLVQKSDLDLYDNSPSVNFENVIGEYTVNVYNQYIENSVKRSNYILEPSAYTIDGNQASVTLTNESFAFIEVYQGIISEDAVDIGYYNSNNEFQTTNLYNSYGGEVYNEETGLYETHSDSKYAFINTHHLGSNELILYINTKAGLSYQHTFNIEVDQMYLFSIPESETPPVEGDGTTITATIIPGFSSDPNYIELENGQETADDFRLFGGEWNNGNGTEMTNEGNLWSYKNDSYDYRYFSLRNFSKNIFYFTKGDTQDREGEMVKSYTDYVQDTIYSSEVFIPYDATFTFNSETRLYTISYAEELPTLYASAYNTTLGDDCEKVELVRNGDEMSITFDATTSAHIYLYDVQNPCGENVEYNSYYIQGNTIVNFYDWNTNEFYVSEAGNYTLTINAVTREYTLVKN